MAARRRTTVSKKLRKPPATKTTTESGAFSAVWKVVQRIPRGRVATYGQISMMIDRRLTPLGVGWAVRAAGPTAIPWQRVVNASGGISTDDQHPGLQRALLQSEGVQFEPNGRIDLTRYGWKPRAPRPTKTRGR